ncbi:MAG: CRISPR-associated ring nuclease Csm6 [Pseudomonadota bacterium]
MLPHEYPRRILLAVTGLSPQIVTETLYALTQRQTPAFVPTEIRLITTHKGAENARLNLLSGDPGWFHRFCREYGVEGIRFDADCIHVLRDAKGDFLEDIRSPADNEVAADMITDTVRELTSDPNVALHVSIAGGRKTMGYYLGYALSLYGRPQDSLSHVLVSAPFESNRTFYYPTKSECVIHVKQGEKEIAHDASDAVVDLALIPFVRMRQGLDDRLLKGTATFVDSVRSAQRAHGAGALVVDLAGKRIQAFDKVVKIPAAELALLAVLARRAQQALPPLSIPLPEVPDIEWAERYLEEYRLICGEMADTERTEKSLRGGMDGDYFSMRMSRLRAVLRKSFGPVATSRLIDDGGKKSHRYRLNLLPEDVRFERVKEEY